MPPKKHYIFGFFLYTFVVLCAVARFINSCCVQCLQNVDVGITRSYFNQGIDRFFKNPPEIMQSYRVLQDNPLLHPVDSGHWHLSFWAIQKELSETQTRTFFVLYLFYFPSHWYVQRELVGGYNSQVTIWSHRTSTFQEIISPWILRIPPLIHVFVSFKTWAYGTHHILLVIWMVSQTQPASSSGKDEPPPKKTHVVSIAMFHQLGDTWQGGL